MKINTSLPSDASTEQFTFRDKLIASLVMCLVGVFSTAGMIYIFNGAVLFFDNAVTKSRNIFERMEAVAQTPEFKQCIEQRNEDVKLNLEQID